MRIQVVAHPNSRKPRIEEDLLSTLHVYVNEPPLDGRANAAITNSLATYYKIPRSQVILINGEKSKNKVFEISV